MNLKYNFVTNEVAGKIVAVAVGDDAVKFNGFIKMNKTGAEIFNLLKSDLSREELVEELKKIYPEEEETVLRKSAEDFLTKLSQAGVLE